MSQSDVLQYNERQPPLAVLLAVNIVDQGIILSPNKARKEDLPAKQQQNETGVMLKLASG